MKVVFRTAARQRNAQTLVFFLLAWGVIMLLCGLAIDSGLLYLAKARMSRAVDGAALAAVGNFNRSGTPTANRDDVATIMRNFAVANFTDLSSINTIGGPAGGTSGTYNAPNGTSGTTYTYNFNDATQDANGQFRRFVQVVLTTGSSGQIVSATCNARCPVQTYFIGYANYALGGKQNVQIGGYKGVTGLMDLKVSSSAVATRNPRLIMVVLDRSASMLAQGGGAAGLPPAVVQFLDFFDTSSDYIGIVSFGSAARLEMPLTTNFIIAGTNNLIDSYQTNSSGQAEPGVDPESDSSQAKYDPNYATTGIRRLKFGGATAADEGIRLAMEQLMANAGFNNPNVVKYMVIFTDGKWNAARTMVAAPGYTNEVTVPSASATAVFVTNFISANYMTNGQTDLNYYGTIYSAPWQNLYLSSNVNLMVMPTLSPLADMTNAIQQSDYLFDYSQLAPYHQHDTWLSSDGTANETLAAAGTSLAGAPQFISTNSYMSTTGSIKYYTHNFDVWLQPGAVAYLYHAGSLSNTYVSDYTLPTKHISLHVNSGDKVDLVVPFYVMEGILYDGIDLTYPDNAGYGGSGYPRYRTDNFQQAYMWPDDSAAIPNPILSSPYQSLSLERQLMFRNYVNLLTGYYVSRPDDPLGAGFEPLITESNPPGAPRPLNGLGPYYPGAAFYWPFDLVGVDIDPSYALIDPNSGSPDAARHGAYSINMLSPAAAPEWSGELFYKSTSGGGTNVTSGTGTTSASQIMTSADWLNGAPSWLAASGLASSGIMVNESAHNTNITPNPSMWRPVTFNGSQFGSLGLSSITPSGSLTGGYVSDGAGHYYKNAMAWSGRPTHYYDFSQAKWLPIPDNHNTNQHILQLGNWKAQEYAWHARALGVTIFTVGYGSLVSDAQQAFLAQLANSTNTTAGGGSNITFNPSQPIGEQFFATNAAEISNDFFTVGQAINAALTQ
jgi:Flp pilus assembly protein TadG